VRYSIRKVPAGTTSVHEKDAWEVLKTLDTGDPYLVATFHHPSLARWCLTSFRMSIEAQRWDAVVDEPPTETPDYSPMVKYDLPDELVW
jgi:hypothetical protein